MDALPYLPGLDATSARVIALYAAAAVSSVWLGIDFLRRVQHPRPCALRRFPFDGLSRWVVCGWLVLSIAGLLLRLPPTPIFWLVIVALLSVASILGEVAFSRKMRVARQAQAAHRGRGLPTRKESSRRHEGSAARFHEEFEQIRVLRMEILAFLDHLGLKAFALKDEQIEHGQKQAKPVQPRAARRHRALPGDTGTSQPTTTGPQCGANWRREARAPGPPPTSKACTATQTNGCLATFHRSPIRRSAQPWQPSRLGSTPLQTTHQRGSPRQEESFPADAATRMQPRHGPRLSGMVRSGARGGQMLGQESSRSEAPPGAPRSQRLPAAHLS